MSDTTDELACPSAQPDMQDAQVLGVLTETPEGSRVAYLNQRQPVTEEILKSTAPVPPTMVLRFSAKCESGKCVHFDGANCQLAQRIVDRLEPVVEALPPCTIRKSCRWFQQEGRAACMRCPQVTTLADLGDPTMREVAAPPAEPH